MRDKGKKFFLETSLSTINITQHYFQKKKKKKKKKIRKN